LATVSPRERTDELLAAIRQRVHLGRHRALGQDSEFAVAQIVEIAIRALSPAVNDSFTGIACVDWAGDALLVLAEAYPCSDVERDVNGAVRVRVRPLKLDRLVKMAFDQIRQAAADNPAVLIRMLDVIRRIRPRLPGPEPQAALSSQADAIREVATKGHLVAIDAADIEAAWGRATEAAGRGVSRPSRTEC